MSTVRDVVRDLMRDLGMTTVFGNPGSTELPLLQDFPEDFHYILALQEASALGMAEGFARATGNAGFVNLHTAPGLGNAMGAMVTAWHNRTPLLVTAGQQHRDHIATEPLLTGNLVDLARPYVKRSHEPYRAQDVPTEILRAYHTAMTAPQGPVFVSIPMDDWEADVEPIEVTRVSYRTSPDPAALDAATATLAAAANPAIVVGPGVARSGSFDEVVALAEKLRAPVYQEGVGALAGFPQNHPLFYGFLPLAQRPISRKLAPYDAVLVLGTRVFSYYPYIPGAVVEGDTKVVQITDAPNEAALSPTGQSVVGDVSLAAKMMVELLPKPKHETPPPAEAAPVPESSIPMSVPYVMDSIAKTLPEQTIIVDESTSSKRVLHQYIKIDEPDGYLTSEAGGLGFCMPASVGVKLGAPHRPVVCIIGDGSSMYSIQSLWTAAQYGVAVVFIIVNNRGYSILKSFRDLLGMQGVPGLDVPGADLVKVAAGFGVDGESVDDPHDLITALERGLQLGRPYLINVNVDPAVPPLVG